MRKILALSLLVAAGFANAEDFPGGTSSSDEFSKGFGEEQGMSLADKNEAELDRLKIGGSMWNQFQYFGLGASKADAFINPNTLWLYMDARLKNDVRGVVKVKTSYDPTADGGVSSFTGQVRKETQGDLEEMKLMFSAKKKVFFTVGKQKIKWGSGKFWNPTDFLNNQQRNFLYTTDLRLGIPQIKTHIPLGASNFYLIQGLEDADQIEKIRHSARFEIPFNTAELSLSATYKKDIDPLFGVDLSSALGVFDVYAEYAFAKGNDEVFYGSSGSSQNQSKKRNDLTAGLSYEIPAWDSDSITLGLEYFYNSLGYSNTNDYAYVLASGTYQPFKLGQEYAAFSVYLPKPGSWNDVTFTLFNVLSVSDKSAMTRLDSVFTVMDGMSIGLAGGIRYGKSSGEFRLGNQNFDLDARLMIDF